MHNALHYRYITQLFQVYVNRCLDNSCNVVKMDGVEFIMQALQTKNLEGLNLDEAHSLACQLLEKYEADALVFKEMSESYDSKTKR